MPQPVACPCCRAANDAGPACRRCKADLSLLFRLEAERAAAVADARVAAAEGRFTDAVAALERAAQLRGGDDVRRLRGAVALLARDFPSALAEHNHLAAGAGHP